MRNYEAIEQFITDKLKRNLPENLFYHGPHHTLDVLRSAQFIAVDEKISDNDLFLLKVAVLYHDSGFINTYKQHEEASCDLAKSDLPGFGLNEDEINIVCGMIMATKIPQEPKTQLERIIADADLEYLGTDSFDRISNNLFQEVKNYTEVKTQKQWDEIQVSFLTKHQYYTDFCKKNREPQKQKHLNEVKARL